MSDTHHRPANSTRSACWPRVCGVACAVTAVILVVWRGALTDEFHFDDYSNIVENPTIRSLMPLDSFARTGRPLGLYSFALSYHFHQLDASMYRLTNLVIHAVNVMLLFSGILLSAGVIQRHRETSESGHANSSLIIASGVALLWGVHPLTTQAVTNIVQRYESLSAMGYLGAWVGMLLVIRGERKSTGVLWAGLAMILLFAWVGLLSKEIFATAPLVILLFDRLVSAVPFRNVLRQRWLAYLFMLTPYVWFVPSVARWFNPARHSSMGFGLESVTWWEYLRTQPEVILHYLKLSVWPTPLCFDYAWRIQQNPVVYYSLGLVILSLIVAALWLYVTGVSRSDSPTVALTQSLTGWLMLSFFIILAPSSSFVPIADLCFEHRMYLPLAVVLAGLFLLYNVSTRRIATAAQNPTVVRLGMTLGFAAIIMLLGWRTHLRNRDYRDGVVMWTTVVKVRPDNPRAWYALGAEQFRKHQYEDALAHIEKAISLDSSVGYFYSGLGDCLRELNRPEEATQQFLHAIELNPTLARAHNSLGVIRQRNGDWDAAEASFRIAMKLELPEAPYNLAVVLIDKLEYPEAASLLEQVLADNPESALAARRLAWILATAPDDDLRDGRRARELLESHYQIADSDSPYVWETYAAVLAEQQSFDDAVQAAQRALEFAEQRDDSELIAAIDERLACYRQQRPWRARLEMRDRRLEEGNPHE